MPPIRSSHHDKENDRPAGGPAPRRPPTSRRGGRPVHADRAARERRQARANGAPGSFVRLAAQVQRDVDAAHDRNVVRGAAARANSEYTFGGVQDMSLNEFSAILQGLSLRDGLQQSGFAVPPPPALPTPQDGAMDQLISGFDTMDLESASAPSGSAGEGEGRRRRIQTKRDLANLVADLKQLSF